MCLEVSLKISQKMCRLSHKCPLTSNNIGHNSITLFHILRPLSYSVFPMYSVPYLHKII